jgi:hypothetical protein
LVIKTRACNYLNSPQGINPQINGLMSGGMSIWRIRYNKEITTLYGNPELSTVIKLRRLQWTGHIQRMESQSIPRMVMAGQMFGKRPVEKPKKRWMDAVKEDSCQILNWRNWKKKARDRDGCRSRIKEARARFGTVAPLLTMKGICRWLDYKMYAYLFSYFKLCA